MTTETTETTEAQKTETTEAHEALRMWRDPAKGRHGEVTTDETGRVVVRCVLNGGDRREMLITASSLITACRSGRLPFFNPVLITACR